MTVRELILTAAEDYAEYKIDWTYNGDTDSFDNSDSFPCLKSIPHFVCNAQVSRWGVDGDILWIECM